MRSIYTAKNPKAVSVFEALGMIKCQHCSTPIYKDTRGKWRHSRWVSWCRTVAVGPNEKCWCGQCHKEDAK